MSNVSNVNGNNENVKVFLKLEGSADELYKHDERNEYKSTTLVDEEGTDDEVLTVTIDSLNPHGTFRRFDELLGKRIRITVEIL